MENGKTSLKERIFAPGTGTEFEETSQQTKNYKIAAWVLTGLIALLGVYMAYRYISADVNWTALVEWNCFKSPLFAVLSFIGFFLQFFNWTHASYTEYYHWKDPYTGKDKYERNDDILSWLFSHLLWPLIWHVALLPMLYGALMYYPLMCIIWLISTLVPVIVMIAIIAFVYFFYTVTMKFQPKLHRNYLLGGAGAVSALILLLLALPVTNTLSGSDSSQSQSVANGYSQGFPKLVSVTVDTANIRKGPGKEYAILKEEDSGINIQVMKGTIMLVYEERGDWFMVGYDYKGSLGFISKTVCQELQFTPISEESVYYDFSQENCEECCGYTTFVRQEKDSRGVIGL